MKAKIIQASQLSGQLLNEDEEALKATELDDYFG
jgi:hypothetical protein